MISSGRYAVLVALSALLMVAAVWAADEAAGAENKCERLKSESQIILRGDCPPTELPPIHALGDENGRGVESFTGLYWCTHTFRWLPTGGSINWGGSTICQQPVAIIANRANLYLYTEVGYVLVDSEPYSDCGGTVGCSSIGWLTPAVSGTFLIEYCHTIFAGADGSVPMHCHWAVATN